MASEVSLDGETEEKLIKCVQAYPELYDPSHINYRNGGRRAQVWMAIGKEFNFSADKVHKKWMHLRDYYKKKQSRPNLSSFSMVQRQNNLAFLEKFCTSRKKPPLDALKKESNEFEFVETKEIDLSFVDEGSLCSETEESIGSNSGQKHCRMTSFDEQIAKPTIDNSSAGETEIDLFFKTMAKTVSKFSPRLQIQVKKEFSELLFKHELLHLDNQ